MTDVVLVCPPGAKDGWACSVGPRVPAPYPADPGNPLSAWLIRVSEYDAGHYLRAGYTYTIAPPEFQP